GYDARLQGRIEYDRSRKRFTRFDAVALGEHWGAGRYTGKARPGRQPLGIAFELLEGKSPADRVPPQAIREIGAYYGRY
ncbi:MAG: hypothetical protein OER86_06570, partial [Phycisphaerae bacterium]|nr:hypothetical protein [Phycisphaerae bacterium]